MSQAAIFSLKQCIVIYVLLLLIIIFINCNINGTIAGYAFIHTFTKTAACCFRK